MKWWWCSLCTRQTHLIKSLPQWNSSLWVDMWLHPETYTRFRANQHIWYVLSGEAANINLIVFGLTTPWLEPTIYWPHRDSNPRSIDPYVTRTHDLLTPSWLEPTIYWPHRDSNPRSIDPIVTRTHDLLTPSWLEPTIYRTREKHNNHNTNDAMWRQLTIETSFYLIKSFFTLFLKDTPQAKHCKSFDFIVN
jgi:hypothetical protein